MDLLESDWIWSDRGSIPRVGMKAAIAVGPLPYPSRTRRISPLAFRGVLGCANPWETRFAACPFIRIFIRPSVATLGMRVHQRSLSVGTLGRGCLYVYTRLLQVTRFATVGGPTDESILSATNDHLASGCETATLKRTTLLAETAPRWQSSA